MAVKTLKPIRDDKLITKYRTYQDANEAREFFNYERDPKWIHRLIYTMFEWWDKKRGETVEDFCEEYRLHRVRLWELAKSNKEFGEAYTEWKQLMANADIKGCKHKAYDKDVVMRYIHTLDDKYLAINKYHSDLKNEEAKNSGVVYIEVDKTKVRDEKTNTETISSIPTESRCNGADEEELRGK